MGFDPPVPARRQAQHLTINTSPKGSRVDIDDLCVTPIQPQRLYQAEKIKGKSKEECKVGSVKRAFTGGVKGKCKRGHVKGGVQLGHVNGECNGACKVGV